MTVNGVERTHPRLRDDDLRARVGRHAHSQMTALAGHPTSLGSRVTSLRHAAAPGPAPPAATGVATAGSRWPRTGVSASPPQRQTLARVPGLAPGKACAFPTDCRCGGG